MARSRDRRGVRRLTGTVDEWIEKDSIPFRVDSDASIDGAADRILARLGDAVELLGLGEALHGSEEILLVRNRVFQRLVDAHGYSAMVIETSSIQARAINDYVLGRRDASDPGVQEWFGSGFGAYDANRELVEWMRERNRAHSRALHFYGFDIPLANGALGSPGRALDIVFDFEPGYRDGFTPLLGDSTEWEKPEAWYDPSHAIGRSARATELRTATADLLTDLQVRAPELAAAHDRLAFLDALHHARLAARLLEAHNALATPGAYARMLGLRDLVMAANLEHYLALEKGRGKVFVYAAAGHLKRGQTEWRLPPEPAVKVWWAAGAQVALRLGEGYRVIGMGLGTSEPNGVGDPEPGTLEADLLKSRQAMFLPMPGEAPAPAPVRTGSSLNPTYFVLSPASFSEFDALVFLPSTTYPRGAEPLSSWTG